MNHKILLTQLKRIKTQQLSHLDNVKHQDDKHIYGYDLCRMLLKRYTEGRLGFELPPPPDFSKHIKRTIYELYNNFEKIKVLAFFELLKSKYIQSGKRFDESWNVFLKDLRHSQPLNEEKVIINKEDGRFINMLNNLLGSII